MGERFRIFATTDIGKEALDRLREKGWEVEVYDHLPAPPKKLILEKVRSGIDALITTLRDKIDKEVFSAGAAAGLKVVAQDAVGFDNIDREAANQHRIPFTNTPEVLTDATAEFAFLMLGAVARKLYPAEVQVRENKWTTWHCAMTRRTRSTASSRPSAGSWRCGIGSASAPAGRRSST
jgi:glyoxylate reductase